MNKILPITPSELQKVKGDNIPEVVIEAVNFLLATYTGKSGSIIITQKDIERKIMETYTGMIPLYWYNFELLYSQYGWVVNYDSPGYCESYDAYYKFTPLRQG